MTLATGPTRRSYQCLLVVLEEMDYARLLAQHDPADPESKLINMVISDTFAHYREHRRIIQALTNMAA